MKSRCRVFDAVVTVASWEPRFLLGLRRTLQECTSKRIIAYFVREYNDRTEEARKELRQVGEEARIDLQEEEISFGEPAETWLRLGEEPWTQYGIRWSSSSRSHYDAARNSMEYVILARGGARGHPLCLRSP